jgi:mannose-1-phosphate guanylyltransferase
VVGHGRALLDSAGPEWTAAAESVIDAQRAGADGSAPHDGFERWAARRADRFEDAVLPRSSALVVARADVEWLDVGTWPALFEGVDASPGGNVVDGPVTALDAGGNVVVSTGTPVVVAGVKNVLVVVTGDQVLVCDGAMADQVGMIARAARGEPA